MILNNNNLKMLAKFRMYVEITNPSYASVYNKVGITEPTFTTIMKNEKYIPQQKVQDKISLFMDCKLTELQQLIDC